MKNVQRLVFTILLFSILVPIGASAASARCAFRPSEIFPRGAFIRRKIVDFSVIKNSFITRAEKRHFIIQNGRTRGAYEKSRQIL
jgi:hypothetical protein